MSTQLQTAFIVLLIGMGTVFLVLFLIVQIGQLLIKLVNKYSANPPRKVSRSSIQDNAFQKNNPSINPAKLAAITAAINITTNGQASIIKVERMGPTSPN